jgi:hypothetical protein
MERRRAVRTPYVDFIQEWGETNQIRVERDAFADRLKISAAHALGVFENELAFCNDLKMYGNVSVSH